MKILVVDDSSVARQSMESMIELLGHTAVLAASGKEGVELYKKDRPDIVTMDLNMPVMDGISTLKLLKRIDPSAKVIMSTANGDDQLVIEAIGDGASGYILKPIVIDVLKGAFHKAIDGHTVKEVKKEEKVKTISDDELEKDLFDDL